LGAFSIVHFVAYPLYFVFGYLLIAAMYATVGAAMKDVHSGGAQGMVGIVPYLPMMFVAAIIEHPEQTWIRIASFFPPFTPSLMLMYGKYAALREIWRWGIRSSHRFDSFES